MRTDLSSAEQNRSPLPNINQGENYNCWNLPEEFRPARTETICGLAKELNFARRGEWRGLFRTPSALPICATS